MLVSQVFALVVVLGLFLAVWRYDSGRRFIFTPFMLVMYFALLRMFPAYFYADNLGIASGPEPLLVATIAFTAFIVGFVFAYFYRRNGSATAMRFSKGSVPHLTFRPQDHVAVLAVACALTVLGLWFYRGMPATFDSLVSALSGSFGLHNALSVTQHRFALTKGAYFGGEYRGQGMVNQFMWIGWALVSAYTVLYWQEKRTRFSVAVLVFAVFVAWVFAAGSGNRGPFLIVLITLVATYSYRRAISLRGVILGFLGACVLGIALSVYSAKMYFLFTNSATPLLTAMMNIVNRILLGNGVNDVRVIEYVNSGLMDVRWGGEHLRNFITAIPGVSYGKPLAYELYKLVNPAGHATTFLSGTYLSTVYVDFFVYGLVPIYFFVGCFVGAGQRWLFRLQPTPWNISVAGVAAYIMAMAFRSGFVSVIASVVVMITIMILHFLVMKLTQRFTTRSVVHACTLDQSRAIVPSVQR